MIKKYIVFLIAWFFLTGCDFLSSRSDKTYEKPQDSLQGKLLDLKQKELELKERELDLREREMNQKGRKNNNAVSVSRSSMNTDQNSFYIVSVDAVISERDAQEKAFNLRQSGYSANYLWIPDYASLSGAQMYAVYIGPYSSQYECEVATENYRKIQPGVYGLLVNQSRQRVQINGIGKVKVSTN